MAGASRRRSSRRQPCRESWVSASNLLAVPVVALIVPAALPGAMVIPGIPMAVTMAVHEREHVDRRGTGFLLLGRVPGTLLGVAVVAAVSSDDARDRDRRRS